jgi:hypothetical protein
MALAPFRAYLVFLPLSLDNAKASSKTIETTNINDSNILNSFKNIMLSQPSENIVEL